EVSLASTLFKWTSSPGSILCWPTWKPPVNVKSWSSREFLGVFALLSKPSLSNCLLTKYSKPRGAVSWVRDAEAQVQQRIPPACYETDSQEGLRQEGPDDSRSPVSAKTCNGIPPVLRNLREESVFQSGHARLEDLHCLPQHRTG